ncbi:alpha/beta fold hydrolase [Methylopila musalis]|uniref:Alpha/beta fold hydrolase n=1 Tax=Methylopila musalis TaxID=1134781 RepID=A0ABW3Z3K8_9HYPH
MARFVLVHGSFHGAWCWERLTPLLEAAGHQTTVPNLPASGGDPAPMENADLDAYATRVAGVIDGIAGQVILVGHSMGGIVSAQVAELRPHRLAAVVYVNGLMLRDGESLGSFLDAHAHLEVDDLVLKNMVVSADGAEARFPAEKAADVFYGACAPDAAAWAAARLGPQRTKVYGDRLRLTPERFGTVRRAYVRGLKDNAVSLAYQDAMLGRTPCDSVFDIDGDHSPFLSAPERLAGILDQVAAA